MRRFNLIEEKSENMKNFEKHLIKTFIFTILLNILACSSTLLLHELGHFFTGLQAGCESIKLVILDSELGTYTEMNCPSKQPFYFSIVGAFLFVLPLSFSFLLIKNFPERNLFWVSFGFNLTIGLTDFPSFFQAPLFILGFLLIFRGEMLLIDDLLFLYKGVE